MNVKKLLKKTAQQDRAQLETESDQLFLENLKAEMEESSPKKRVVDKRIWTIGVPSLIAVIIIIVSIIYFAPEKEAPIKYLEGNFEYIESNLEELNKDASQFEIVINAEIYSFSVIKVIDKISGDTLYYNVRLETIEASISMEFAVVTNSLFQYNAFPDTTKYLEYAGAPYSVKYQTSKSMNETFGQEMLTYSAELRKGDEIIYLLNYSEFMFDQDSALIPNEEHFFKSMQAIIR